MFKRISRRLSDLPSTVAAHLLAYPAIVRWRDMRYEQRRAHFRSQAVASVRLSTIAAELERTGIVLLSLASFELPDAGALLRAGQQVVERQGAALATAATQRDFVLVPPAELARQPEIYRFGLQEQLLDLVEAYLGQPVAYDGVTLQYTPADGRATATRLWHRDREDRRMVKLVVYLNDVDEDGGPFELLPVADVGSGAGPRIDPYLPGPAEQAMLTAGGLGRKAVCCTGAAGTAFLADTARFYHRGRPTTRCPRAAMFFSYFAARPRHPFYCDRSGFSRAQVRSLLDGLRPRQREAALWRRRLPLAWRLIPSAEV